MSNIFFHRMRSPVKNVLDKRAEQGEVRYANGASQNQVANIDVYGATPTMGIPYVRELIISTTDGAGWLPENSPDETIGGINATSWDESAIIGDTADLLPGMQGQFGRTVANQSAATSTQQAPTIPAWTWPTLTKASFQINGDFGSLRKAELQMVCAGIDQLNKVEDVFVIGQQYQFHWGDTDSTPSNGCGDGSGNPAEEYVLYDMSWKFVHAQLIELTFKFVGAGSFVHGVDANNTIALGEGSDWAQFIFDFEYLNEKRLVQSLVDAADYDFQDANGTLADDGWDAADTYKHREAVPFPNSDYAQYAKKWLDKPYDIAAYTWANKPNLARDKGCFGFAVAYRMDNVPDFNETNNLAGNTLTANTAVEVYYSLGYIVHRLINGWLLENAQDKGLADGIKNTKYVMAATAKPRKYLMSTDPLSVLLTSSGDKNVQCTFGPYYALKRGDEGWTSELKPEQIQNSILGVELDDQEDEDGKDFRLDSVNNDAMTGANAGALNTLDLTTFTKDANGDDILLCENILISRNYLRQLDPNKKVLDKEWEASEESSTNPSKADDQISISDFLGAIFKKIKQTTNGYIDLAFHELAPHELYNVNSITKTEEDAKKNYPARIFIINLSEAIDPDSVNNVINTSYEFDIQGEDFNTIKADLASKIPKAMVAEAFGRRSPGKTGGTGQNMNIPPTGNATPEKTEEDKASELRKKFKDVRIKLYESGFDSNSSSAAMGVLKDLNSAVTPKQKVKTENMPYPLQLTLVIQGLYGLRFGDCIKCSFIPDRYDKLGMNIVYSITEVVHEIEAPTATWVTQIKTIARLVDGKPVRASDPGMGIMEGRDRFIGPERPRGDFEATSRGASQHARA